MKSRSKKINKGLWLIIIALITVVALLEIYPNNNSLLNNTKTPIATDFSVGIELTYDDWYAKGTLTKSSEEYIISLDEPEEVEGMAFIYDGSKVSINYMGLSTELSDDSLLLNSVSSSIIESINHAMAGKNISVEEVEENYIVKGKIDKGNYEIEVEQSTGIPLSLEINKMNLACTFRAIQSTDNTTE